AGSTFIVERLGHECGQLVLLARQLLNGPLEAEGTVGRIEGFGVPEVDLELSAGDFMVRGYTPQPILREAAKGPEQYVLGVAFQAGHIDIPSSLAIALPAGRVL